MISASDAGIARLGILRMDQERYKHVHDRSDIDDLIPNAYDCWFTWCKHGAKRATATPQSRMASCRIKRSLSLLVTEYAHTHEALDCVGKGDWDLLFKVYQDIRNPQQVAANNTNLMKDSLAECPDVRAVSAKTSSYIVTTLDSSLLRYMPADLSFRVGGLM